MKYMKRVLTLALALSVGFSTSCFSRLNVAASDGGELTPSAKINYIKGGDKDFILDLTLSNVTNSTCAEFGFTYDSSKLKISIPDEESDLTSSVTVSDPCSIGLDAYSKDTGEYDSTDVTGIWANFKAEDTIGAEGTGKNAVSLMYLVHPAAPVNELVTSLTENENARVFSKTGDYKFLSVPFSFIDGDAISDDTSEIIDITSLKIANNGSIVNLKENGLTVETNIKEAGNTVILHANGGTFKAANFADGTRGELSGDATTLTLTCDAEGNITLPNRVDITSPHAKRMFYCWSPAQVNYKEKVTTTNVPDASRFTSGTTYNSDQGTELYAVWAYVADFDGNGRLVLTEVSAMLNAFKTRNDSSNTTDPNNNLYDIDGNGRLVLTEVSNGLNSFKNRNTSGYFDIE